MIMMANRKTIPLDWLKGQKTEKDKEDFSKSLYNSNILRELRKIVQQKLRELDNQEGAKNDYDSPSWAYKQADRNGHKRGLQTVLELTQFMETQE